MELFCQNRTVNYFHEKLHLRRCTGFWIRFCNLFKSRWPTIMNLLVQLTHIIYLSHYLLQNVSKNFTFTAQKMKFSIKDFFSKCDLIRSYLRIWSHLLNKFLMENFDFCAVFHHVDRTFADTMCAILFRNWLIFRSHDLQIWRWWRAELFMKVNKNKVIVTLDIFLNFTSAVISKQKLLHENENVQYLPNYKWLWR